MIVDVIEAANCAPTGEEIDFEAVWALEKKASADFDRYDSAAYEARKEAARRAGMPPAHIHVRSWRPTVLAPNNIARGSGSSTRQVDCHRWNDGEREIIVMTREEIALRDFAHKISLAEGQELPTEEQRDQSIRAGAADKRAAREWWDRYESAMDELGIDELDRAANRASEICGAANELLYASIPNGNVTRLKNMTNFAIERLDKEVMDDSEYSMERMSLYLLKALLPLIAKEAAA